MAKKLPPLKVEMYSDLVRAQWGRREIVVWRPNKRYYNICFKKPSPKADDSKYLNALRWNKDGYTYSRVILTAGAFEAMKQMLKQQQHELAVRKQPKKKS